MPVRSAHMVSFLSLHHVIKRTLNRAGHGGSGLVTLPQVPARISHLPDVECRQGESDREGAFDDVCPNGPPVPRRPRLSPEQSSSLLNLFNKHGWVDLIPPMPAFHVVNVRSSNANVHSFSWSWHSAGRPPVMKRNSRIKRTTTKSVLRLLPFWRIDRTESTHTGAL
jgi:hypothetical protein